MNNFLAQDFGVAAMGMSSSGNGGEVSDKFTVGIIDQIIECVKAAKSDDSSFTMVQRVRVLKSLAASLDSMFSTEETGISRLTLPIGEINSKRIELFKLLKQIFEQYAFYAVASEKERLEVIPAQVLQEKSLPILVQLRSSVDIFRAAVIKINPARRTNSDGQPTKK